MVRVSRSSNKSDQVHIKTQSQEADIQGYEVQVEIASVKQEKEEELHSQVPKFEGEDSQD